MTFDAIRGHDGVVRMLRRAVAEDRLAHAYLFAGPPGVGKTLVAGVLANTLQCAAGGGVVCGACPACEAASRRAHPDIQWVVPEAGTATLKIEDVRRVQHVLERKPYAGRRAVVILLNADRLTEEAANALLGVLEEPPGRALVILTSAHPEDLLPTIVSRCVQVRFTPLPVTAVSAILEAQGVGAPDQWRWLSRLGEGSAGRALAAAGPASGAHRRLWLDHLARRTLPPVEPRQKDRQQLLEGLPIVLSWYRDLLVLAVTGDPGLVMNGDRVHELITMAEAERPDVLGRQLDAILATYQHLERSANAKLAGHALRLALGLL